MAENTAISWTDHTFNPWIGCTKVSPACDHCYAEAWDKRYGGDRWKPGAERAITSPANWKKPRKWNAAAERAGVRHKVFCASLADVFDNKVPEFWRGMLWDLIRETPALDWLLLTKRPQNIEKMLPQHWGIGWPNVWLGTTVENQTEAERRIPALLSIPARVRFLSCEPLLGPVDLRSIGDWNTVFDPLLGERRFDGVGPFFPDGARIHWVIAGGESGPGARPSHPDWFRALRDQCADTGTAFHFKQWGDWFPGEIEPNDGGVPGVGRFIACPDIEHDPSADDWEGRWKLSRDSGASMLRVGKKTAGRMLDGVTHDGFPGVCS